MNPFTSILKAPELAHVPEQYRLLFVRVSGRLGRPSIGAQVLEALFAVAICAAELVGLVIGYFRGGFWSALGCGAISMLLIIALFVPAFRVVGRSRLRRFLQSEECQLLLRRLDGAHAA